MIIKAFCTKVGKKNFFTGCNGFTLKINSE